MALVYPLIFTEHVFGVGLAWLRVLSMETPDSQIDSADVVILFADLQAGIVELTQTNPSLRRCE